MDTSNSRMRVLDGAEARLCEKRAAHLYDMANLLAPSPFTVQMLKDADFRERYLAWTAMPDELPACIPENRAAVLAQLQSLREADKLHLCRILARRVGLGAKTPLERLIMEFFSEEESEIEQEEADDEGMDGNRVSYLRSSYADQAYMRFSEVVPELRADYATSFAGVCETVYDNRARLCILPLETNTGGVLTGFRGLIARHGLKIICTCDVATGEEEITRFALLKKTHAPPEGQKSNAPAYFFRFTVIEAAEISLRAVLSAAEAYELAVYKTDTVPISYTESGFAFDVTLRAEGDLAAFLTYLTLEAPSFESVGLYAHWGS